jgi:hypothetical protein
MKTKKKFGDQIYIEWIDAIERVGWKTVEEAVEVIDEVYCKTCAFYLDEDKEYVKVAHTIGKSIKNDVLGVLLIPKKWIRKIK